MKSNVLHADTVSLIQEIREKMPDHP